MEPGEVVAERFEIEARVGAGGMGVVYRSRDRTTGDTVALKILREDVDQGMDRFFREAATLARLEHPEVVGYVAHGLLPAQGGAYLATEWIEGETLSARLKAGLSVRDALVIGRAVARALGAGHRAGIVHRDVKPGNVMLVHGDPARTKLLDFGIVRLAAEQTLTSAGMMLGTPGYMAPEQARGVREIGPTADVFGLGALLYRCLAGKAPFAGGSAAGTLARTLFDEPEPLGEQCPAAKGALAELVHRMLSKDPGARPKDGDVAAEAIDRLLAHLGGEGDVPAEPGSARELPSLTRTERRIVSVLFVDPGAAADEAPTTIQRDGALVSDAERSIADAHGLRLERLVSGARVLTLAGVGSAKDQALRVVRAAVALAPLVSGATLAVATGRGELRGQSAVGEAIDRAEGVSRERAESAIFVDDVTAGLVEDSFELARDGDAWRVRGERVSHEAGVRTLLGKATPCVGRERELSMLGALVAESADESVARAAVVTAPAGLGKSRLRHEWLARMEAMDPPPRVLVARADPVSAGSPLGMLRQIVGQALGVRGGDAPAVARARLGARASALFRADDAARIGEFASELLGCGGEGGSEALRAARRDRVILGDQMLRAALDVMGRLVEQGPLVLVLEDLHWGDVATVRFVTEALRELDNKPIVAVAFARPEVSDLFPELWAERGALAVRLGELTRGASERLVRAALGDRATPEVVDRIVLRAAGNALFLEELVRATAEGHGDATPETLLVMMHARLDGFEADARRVLRAASVFGQAFWDDGVRALALDANDASLDVDGWLGTLVQREVLVRRPASRFAGHDEYAFRHALVREAAYDMLTEGDRRVGHGLAGAWLESAGEGDAMALGEHFERGGDPARAAHWFARGAEQAFAGNDFAGAVRLARRSMDLRTDPEHAGPLWLLVAQANRWGGKHEEALDAAQRASALLAEGSIEWYASLAELSVEAGPLRRVDLVREVKEALLAASPKPGAEGARVGALSRTSTQLSMVLGLREEARPLLDALFAAPAAVLEGDPLARGSHAQSACYLALVESDYVSYLDHARASKVAFLQAGDLRTVAATAGNEGYAAMNLGDYPAAEASLREAHAMAKRMGLKRIQAIVEHNLGLLLARMGRLEEAEVVGREAARSLGAQGDRRLEAFALAYLAETLRLQRRLDESVTTALLAVERGDVFPGARAYGLGVAARAALDAGDAAAALERAAAAKRIVDDGATEDGDAMVRLVHALALEATGDRAGAAACAADAWKKTLERAAKVRTHEARERYLRVVPEHAETAALAARLAGP